MSEQKQLKEKNELLEKALVQMASRIINVQKAHRTQFIGSETKEVRNHVGS